MLRVNADRSRKRKFRDRKRYFRKMELRARTYELYLEDDMWWNFHHEHLDWWGRGDLRWRYREQSITSHALLLERIASQLGQFDGEFQLWLSISSRAAGEDAVYLHSSNPHSDFPESFAKADWSPTAVPEEVRSLAVPELVWGEEKGTGYVAFHPHHGLDLRG